jgi:hypothetical protein
MWCYTADKFDLKLVDSTLLTFLCPAMAFVKTSYHQQEMWAVSQHSHYCATLEKVDTSSYLWTSYLLNLPCECFIVVMAS